MQLILIGSKVKADKNTQAGPCYLKKGEKGYPKLTGQPSFISFYFTIPVMRRGRPGLVSHVRIAIRGRIRHSPPSCAWPNACQAKRMETPLQLVIGIDGGATYSHGVAATHDGRVLSVVHSASMNFTGS